MELLAAVIGFVVGFVVGAVGAFIHCQARTKQAVAEVAAATKASEAAAQQRCTDLQERLSAAESTLKQREDLLTQLNGQLAKLKADEATFNARIDEFRRAQEELKNAFAKLAAEALKANNEAFLQQAKAEAEKHLAVNQAEFEKRHKAFEDLVKPVKEGLEKYDQKIVQFENDRNVSYGKLANQLQAVTTESSKLKGETAKLVTALRGAPTARGRWGEMELRRVVELAGMEEHVSFEEQVSVTTTEDSVQRPDLLVHLPGRKTIVVDAKVSAKAYLEALEEQTEEGRAAKLDEHAAQVRVQIQRLSSKRYWEQFENAPEIVVMFMPEPMLMAALHRRPEIMEEAMEKKVVLATPMTLLAQLTALAYGWRQERIAESAQAISALGKELYDRLSTLGKHFGELGGSLENAVKKYNETVGSLESRVLPSARRFKELGAATGDDLAVGGAIEHSPRELQAPELKAGGKEQ